MHEDYIRKNISILTEIRVSEHFPHRFEAQLASGGWLVAAMFRGSEHGGLSQVNTLPVVRETRVCARFLEP